MAFFINKHPDNPSSQYGGYASHRDIAMYLGIPFKISTWNSGEHSYSSAEISKMPADFEGTATVPLKDGRTTTIRCGKGHQSLIGRRGKSSKHRTFADCPDCGKAVPAGRAHQHKC